MFNNRSLHHIFLFLLTCLLFTFASCSFDGASSSDGGAGTPSSNGIVIVSGNVASSGAVPSGIASSLNQAAPSTGASSGGLTSTAFPAVPVLGGSTYTYIVKAVNTADESETYSGSSAYDNGERTYTVGIPVPATAKTYKITVEVKTSSDGVTILTGESESFPISAASPVVTKNVELSAIAQVSGLFYYGMLALDVTVDSDTGINSAKAVNCANDTVIAEAEKDGTTYTFSKGTLSGSTFTDALETGSYQIKYLFYKSTDSSGDPCYSFTDSANIFNGLTTNTWVKNGNEPYFVTATSGGVTATTCRITKAMVDSWEPDTFWVSAGGSSENSGTFLHPLDSIENAVAKMNNSQIDYTIYVMGTLTGNQGIPATLTTDRAKSLTICGDNNEEGTLGAGASCALAMNTSVPVVIKNLTITGANGSVPGAGICVAAGELTIKEDTLITGNKTGNYGGGIYIAGSSVVTMEGGTISGNSGERGGAVFVEAGATFNIKGSAYIPYGVTESGSLVKDAGKNDVFLEEGSEPKKITVAGTLTGHSSSDPIAVTYSSWTRGKQIAAAVSGVTLTDAIAQKFTLTAPVEDGWQNRLGSSGSSIYIMAPFYIAGTGHTTGTIDGSDASGISGTKSSPYATLSKVLQDITDIGISGDYIINVDGKLTGSHSIENTITSSNASSILIQGVTGNTNDMIDADGDGSALSLFTSVPVTIKNFKITGGNVNGPGGGINLCAGELTLKDNVLIEGNSVTTAGGGICVDPSASLRVSGNVVVFNNTDQSSPPQPSNVYLPAGKKIQVLDSLVSGSGASALKAKIGVSSADTPVVGQPVEITSGYGFNEDGYNEGVVPGRYFVGDGYGITYNTTSGEAALAVGGGVFDIDPLSRAVMISANRKYINPHGTTQKTLDFSVSVSENGSENPVTVGDGDDEIQLTYELEYEGGVLPQSYYTPSGDSVTFATSLQQGKYTMNVNGVYKDRTYNASIDFAIVNADIPEDCVAAIGTTIGGAVGSVSTSVSEEFISGRIVSIPTIIACDHEVTQGEYETFCFYNSAKGDDLVKPVDKYGRGSDYPVYYVTWYDALVYCNLRSMADNLTPVYSIAGETDPRNWPDIAAGTGDDAGKYAGPEGFLATTWIESMYSRENAVWDAVIFNQDADGWRLPTHVEWEYLARSENTEDYAYSGSNDRNAVAWHSGNSKVNNIASSHIVKSMNPNALGLYDMSGNVAEMCWDMKATVNQTTPYTGPDGRSSGILCRVTAGGTYNATELNLLAKISSCPVGQVAEGIGFRVVRTVQ